MANTSAESGVLKLPPSRDAIQAVLAAVAPSSMLASVQPLAGSYSNSTHLVAACTPDGSMVRLVVRRYVHGDRAGKSRLEYWTLIRLQQTSVPAPVPLLLDDTGAVLGTPGIVTSYVPGAQLMHPSEHPAGTKVWARALAKMLVRIHFVPCDGARKCLLDADTEATWFLRAGAVPDYMMAHPDGRRVWQAVHDLRPHIRRVKPGLVHLDYWRGNVLWDQGQITAVVDWEEAAYGDPGIDVAYCLMEMVIMGFLEEAAEFLRVYEAETNRPVANLHYWELAAAARPMTDTAGWLTKPEKADRFRQFIGSALGSAGL